MMNYLICFHRRFVYPLFGSIILLVLLGPIMAQGATYYVSLSGSDSNPGTVSQPFKTFARAIQPLRPGDTLYIRAGLWTQRLDLQANNTTGTSGNYIKIAGYPGEKVTIRYTEPTPQGYGVIKARGIRGYLIFENLILDGINIPAETGWKIVSGNHHFILRNLEIKNFRDSGLFIAGDNIQVINCTIHDQIITADAPGSRYYGIYFSRGANGLLQGNKVYNNPGGGMQLYPGPISNLEVRGNAIYSNNKLSSSPVGGIILYGTSSSPISNAKIYNNLVYKNGTSTSGSASGIRIVYASGTKILNNTIYGNKTYGLQISSSNSTLAQNNIIYSNVAGVGSLLPVKRWDRLLKAAQTVMSVGVKDARFRLAGDGPLRSELERSAADLGVSHAVEFLGTIHDIPAFLQGAKFLVHTSESEGCPNVVMEAMAAGRAIVATDAGDIPYLVEDGKTGFVIRQGDDEALADRIVRLWTNPDLCRQMGKNARTRAEQEFELSLFVTRTLDAYRAAGWKDEGGDAQKMHREFSGETMTKETSNL